MLAYFVLVPPSENEATTKSQFTKKIFLNELEPIKGNEPRSTLEKIGQPMTEGGLPRDKLGWRREHIY